MTKKKEATISSSEQRGEKVPISSLGTLQFFSHQSHVYSKRKVHPDGIKALSKKGDKLITLPPDTLVIKI